MPKSRAQDSDPHGLTAQQRHFVQEYCWGDHRWNGTKSAIAAAYSEKTARSQAADLLARPNIKAAVDEERKKVEAEAGDRRARIRQEIDLIAFADLSEAFDANGKLLAPREMPPGVRRCIAGIEVDELFEGYGAERVQVGETRKVKLWSKVDALKLAATEEGMLTEKLELDVKGRLEHLIAMAQARRAAKKAEGSK